MEKADLTGMVPLWEAKCLHIVLCLACHPCPTPFDWIHHSWRADEKPSGGSLDMTDNHMRIISALKKTAVSIKTASINKSSWKERRLLKTLDVVKLFVKMLLKGSLIKWNKVVVKCLVLHILNTLSRSHQTLWHPSAWCWYQRHLSLTLINEKTHFKYINSISCFGNVNMWVSAFPWMDSTCIPLNQLVPDVHWRFMMWEITHFPGTFIMQSFLFIMHKLIANLIYTHSYIDNNNYLHLTNTNDHPGTWLLF